MPTAAYQEMPHGTLPRPGQAHHQRTVKVLRLLQVATIALPILFLAAGGRLAWNVAYQDASDETDRIADLVFESSSKLLGAQLLALEQVRLTIEPFGDDEIITHEQELHDRFAAMLRYLPHLRDLYVINRDGRALVDATRYPAPASTAPAERDYFRHFSSGGTGLFIGKPGNRMVDNLPFVPVSIARNPSGGSFDGVIGSSVDPAYFENFFRRVLAGYPDFNGREIALRRGDGELLVRSNPLPTKFLAGSQALTADLLQSAAASGHFISTKLDGTRIVAWHRLSEPNLVVFTSVPLHSVLVVWLETMTPYLIFGLLAAAAMFGITVIALRNTRLAAAAERHADQERTRREKAEDAIRQSQKMEALGQLTGGVAHDFNNLLAVILGSAELAKTRSPDRIGQLLDNIIHAAERGATLTRQLLSFSRSQALAPRVVDPHREVPRLMDLLKPSLRGDIGVGVQVADDAWLVEIDPGEWEIALLNIAVNARDAMPSGGSLTVEVANQHIVAGSIATAPDLEGDFVRIALRDTGPGIPPEVAARAFEPFFTTKDVGRGTGLGLSQVYGFARQAGGAATIAAGPAGGTTVTLFLPRTQKPIQTFSSATESTAAQDDSIRRILLVEDNQDVAAITIEMIRNLGYDVVHVDRARTALDRLAEPDAVYHLMLSDIVMPDGMNGLQLARMVRARMPDLPIILVSGYNDQIPAQPLEFQVLRKPVPADQLAQALRTQLGLYPRIVVDNTRTA